MDADEGVRCRAGSSSFWVTWDGKMTPCGMMTTPVVYPLKIGFEEAWKTLLKETTQIRTPSACGGCAYKELCGVCAAVCYTETGAFDKVPSYLCRKTEAEVRITQEMYSERKNDEN
jgi:radical SAM protein with 4Fe4S-binding SPASM domain